MFNRQREYRSFAWISSSNPQGLSTLMRVSRCSCSCRNHLHWSQCQPLPLLPDATPFTAGACPLAAAALSHTPFQIRRARKCFFPTRTAAQPNGGAIAVVWRPLNHRKPRKPLPGQFKRLRHARCPLQGPHIRMNFVSALNAPPQHRQRRSISTTGGGACTGSRFSGMPRASRGNPVLGGSLCL